MRRAHPRYLCYPSVLCVGKEVRVSIVPRDNSRRFFSERDYELGVVGLRDDELSYHVKQPLDYPYEVEHGCLCFTLKPEREQEYSIRFREKGGAEQRIALYAVREDLYGLRPLKGDLHSHTWYSDGQDGIAMTPADYREEGFDFFALTDHNRMFTSELAAELYNGIPLGMHIMTGEEIHTPGSLVHIVHVGGTSSVCSRYIKDEATFEAETAALEETMQEIPEQYRHRTALAHWACREIHKAGGLAIFAHPFWKPNRYNVAEEFLDILFDAKIFDALELMGGVGTLNNNLQLALWQEQAFKGNVLPVVGSSDSHNHDFETTNFGRRFTVVFAKDNTTEAILDAIRNGWCVAGELPLTADADVRFYGSQLRLVAFAHFLFENYFNETWRLCVGEGILMRRYAEGEEVQEALAACCDTVKNFYRTFYGLDPAPAVTGRTEAFLDHCRERQCTEGPDTIGSLLFFTGTNTRRE